MTLRLIDTHCHLDLHYFPEGAEAVMQRARNAGVLGFVVIGVGRNVTPALEAVALAKLHPEAVAATVGVHPHEASSWAAQSEEIRRLCLAKEVVAVGEVGLDYHYDRSPRDVQQRVFRESIALAREVKKPLIIHTRQAPEDTIAILREEHASDVGGIIHCFSEDKPFAEKALDLGFDLSFSGIVTFKTAQSVQEVAAWAPEERILVETDSPYLAPVPFRGKPCEPAYVAYTAQKVADLRGTTLENIARLTTRNAERRFGRLFANA